MEVYVISRLDQWDSYVTPLVTGSKTDAESVFLDLLNSLNEEWEVGWVEYGDDCGPERLARDWQYFEISPTYWKNGKGHFIQLNTYKVKTDEGII